MNARADKSNERHQPQSGPYEPPRVETVLTAEELEREVLYAGDNHSGGL